MTASISSRRAETARPILDVLAERWSPRSFDPDAVVSIDALRTALEAARWSPSANNSQPWRFILARRGTADFAAIADTLLGFNQAWAGSASFLLVTLAETVTAEGKPLRWASYDAGQAIAHLSLQAHADGLHVHQMGGFKADDIRAAFALDPSLDVLSVSAIGVLASPENLPENLRERETAPRSRLTIEDLVLVGDEVIERPTPA